MVEFVSYDGKFPSYCAGRLILKIDGEIVDFGRHCLFSGGSIGIDRDGWEHIYHGAWSVCKIPTPYEKYADEIVKVVNENVPFGCCGGCI